MGQINEERICAEVGNKVFRKDGKSGYVISAEQDADPVVRYFDGEEEKITNTQDYYMIGHRIYGNKLTIEEMDEMIRQTAEVRDKFWEICKRLDEQRRLFKTMLREENRKIDALTRQKWNIQNQMRPDWKEHMKDWKEQKKRYEQNSSDKKDGEE